MKKTILAVTLLFIGLAQEIGINVGDKAKDIVLINPEGKEIKLSSIKGKVVLIDFWASWCGPCRMENPNLVKSYAKYKDAKYKSAKGFDIYSVSLDKNKEAWIAAIAKDQLTWANHVSDLKGWQSSAGADYQVNFIPQNFLINEKGIIVAKNLRGEELDKELDKLLK
jgi:thiol-disulfide isomerase/thioredoxin